MDEKLVMPIPMSAELKIGAYTLGGSKDQKSANYAEKTGLNQISYFFSNQEKGP